jgi:hypothetical protein
LCPINSQNHEIAQAMRKKAIVWRFPLTIHECQMQMPSVGPQRRFVDCPRDEVRDGRHEEERENDEDHQALRLCRFLVGLYYRPLPGRFPGCAVLFHGLPLSPPPARILSEQGIILLRPGLFHAKNATKGSNHFLASTQFLLERNAKTQERGLTPLLRFSG